MRKKLLLLAILGTLAFLGPASANMILIGHTAAPVNASTCAVSFDADGVNSFNANTNNSFTARTGC